MKGKPLLVYDGDCDFCRLWVERWRARTGDRIEYASSQEVAARFPDRPLERFRQAVQFLDADGRWYEAAEGVFRLLAHVPGGRWGLWLYRHFPGFAPVSEVAYRWIADHRPLCTRWTRRLWGKHVAPPGEARTTWLFLRLLGVVYLAAFLSLLPQLLGLFGHQGILPVDELMRSAKGKVGAGAYWMVPSVFWMGASDVALRAVCLAGALFSVLLVAGIVPGLAALGAWASYLSLAAVGTTFLWFQWDSLLLETGFLALFLAPWRLWSPPGADAPRRVALWLARWLLFRFLVASAAVKLSSGDPTWANLTALEHHYETQPIPPWTAWYFHQLPAWFQRLSAAFMFAVEGGAPFLLFGPRRVRFFALGAVVLLQALIFVSGNFGFFNLLTLALCACWLDDGVWRGSATAATRTRRGAFATWSVRAVASVVFLLGLVPFAGAFHPELRWPRPVLFAEQLAAPLRIANGYGLFAVMTTTRPEITIEGSQDGESWKPYAFRYKPGDPRRAPPFLGPHMPRLDWQMWFAALDGVRGSPWFLSFCERLLQGSPPVRHLLAEDPFPGTPPRLVRARLENYRFTTPAERRATGAWWHAEELGLYCPPLTLAGGRLALAVPDSLPH